MATKVFLVIVKDPTVVDSRAYESNIDRKIFDFAVDNRVEIKDVGIYTEPAMNEVDTQYSLIGIENELFKNNAALAKTFIEFFISVRQNWELINEYGDRFNCKPNFHSRWWDDRKTISYIFTFLHKEYGIRARPVRSLTDRDLEMETYQVMIPSNIHVIARKFNDVMDSLCLRTNKINA